MSLSAQIEIELNRSESSGNDKLELAVDGGRLHANFTAVDALACAFDQLGVSSSRWADAAIDDLKHRAEQLSAELSYLLESISPIEIDNQACVVQMRSDPPDQNDDGSKYYELVVSREGIRLSRYTKTTGQPRQVVPAAVTREVFVRLANDLVASNA